MKSDFSWLHLTDLHWGAKSYDDKWDTIFKELLNDIETRGNKYNTRWDAIFFTGDLSFKGNEEEYQSFNKWLKRLKTALKNQGSTPVFLPVPGNHDIVRPQKDNDGLLLLSAEETREIAIAKILDSDSESAPRKMIHQCFANYKKIVHEIHSEWNDRNPILKTFKKGVIPGDFACTIENNSLKIGIIGLNSAFLQLKSGNFKQKITIRTKQFKELFEDYTEDWFAELDTSILLTHHPFNWFDEIGKENYSADIYHSDRFAIHLCGHQHEAFCAEWAKGGATEKKKEFVACSLFGQEQYEIWDNGQKQRHENRKHGYCCGILSKGAPHYFRLFPRVGVKKGGSTWQFDRDTTHFLEDDGGTKQFHLTYKKPQKLNFSDIGSDDNITSIKNKVKQSITKLLNKESLILLRDSIIDTIRDEMPSYALSEPNFSELLLDLPFLDSFRIIDLSVRTCLKDIRSDHDSSTIIRENGIIIIGWLVLLSVNEDWLYQYISAIEKEKNILLEIPVKTHAGVEIIISSIDLSAVELRINSTDSKLYGKNCIPCSNLPESGWEQEENLLKVKELLYKKLYYREIPHPLPTDLNETINARLEYRQETKEAEYLVIDISNIQIDNIVLTKLREDLPALRQVILCGSDKTKAFIVTEPEITARLEEFFQHLILIGEK